MPGQGSVHAARLFGDSGRGPDDDGRDLLAAVVDARRSKELARQYFECVTEPALVDHAVLLLAAAERRYAHLLAEARREGVRLSWADPPGGRT